MKIKTKMRGTVFVVFLLTLVSAVSVYALLDKLAFDGRVVNYSGIVRGATQRLVKLEVSGKPMDDLIQQLDKIIDGLISGSTELQLPAVSDIGYIENMTEVRKSWGELKSAILKGRTDPASRDAILKQSEDFFELTNKAVSAAEKFSKYKIDTLKHIQLFILIVSLIIVIFIWVFSDKHFSSPLTMLASKVDTLVRGDLRLSIDYRSADEIGILSQGMDEMVRSFSTTINTILSIADRLSINTEKIMKSKAEKTKAGYENLASHASQSAGAAEDLTFTITDIAANTTLVDEASAVAMESANKGKNISDGAIEIINQVHASTLELSSMVKNLNESVAEISNVVTVINDIADQTNLLALNAAIEAARAGEQGRGFAVVADEVRKLAEKTIKQTAEIYQKIKAVQEDSEGTAKSMADASVGVSKATEYINEVGSSLTNIVDNVKNTRDKVQQIQTSVNRQVELSDKVASNMVKTSAVVSDMGSMANEVIDDLTLLTGISSELRAASAKFKTNAESMTKADMHNQLERSARIGHEPHPSALGMQFDDSFLVGNQTIDRQHQELFKLKNDLLAVMSEGKGKEEIAKVLHFLEDYVVNHFATEENFMKKYDYPDMHSHIPQHKALLDAVGGFKERFIKNGPSRALLMDIQQAVDNWLNAHIKNVDVLLGKFLASKGNA
ncbi:MAG: bacteriohemerythrin [Nitrospirae bacterium]|nr:bacteriohemerythrin [Nitrospirota bacterium]MBF0533979.1 bacteriohemerythrin [Nitrospirota bacterium]MBF0616138.1 bacteriohemerythrin [Nitrospirota bacterium]